MRILDCVIKAGGDDLWLFHTTSSYRVRLDQEAFQVLESLVAKPEGSPLTDSEALIHDRLAGRGLIAAEGGAPLKVLTKSRLRTLDIELSSRCNLLCGHCFAHMDNQTLMDKQVLERVFEGVADLEPVTFVLNGGEPLLNPIWRWAVLEARRLNLRVVLMTNGTLVNRDVAAFIASARVAKVSVSLDGFAGPHDTLRGPRAFERTTIGIRRLVAEGVQVFVSTMLSEETIARKAEFEHYCLEDLGVAGVRFSAVVPVGKGISPPTQFQIGDAVLRETFGRGQVSEDEAAPGRPEDAWSCDAGVGQCFIGADGSVYACHYFQNLAQPIGHLESASLANLYRRHLEGPVSARLSWRELPGCKECPALQVCQGGCRARAKMLAGSYCVPDPHSCRIHGQ